MTIKQKDENGCGIACLAMWLGMEYEEVRDQYFDDGRFEDRGLTDWDMWRVFSFHHVPIKKWRWKGIEELQGWKAILGVESLNYPGAYHYVYWDGEELHDPSPGKTYTVDMLNGSNAVDDHIVETTTGSTADFDTLTRKFSWQEAFKIIEDRESSCFRYEDDSSLGQLRVLFGNDGDAHLAITPDPDDPSRRSVRFCTPQGGGGSRRTRTALMLLALAMIEDNKESPQSRR